MRCGRAAWADGWRGNLPDSLSRPAGEGRGEGGGARVLAAVAMLADQSGLGRPGRVPGTREWIVAKTRYLVPYRVRGGTLEVLRVFHMSRRLPNKW